VDGLSLSQLMAALRDLVGRARRGGMRSSELSDATITVTSLGEETVESVFPIIYPPQVAIIGFGMVLERPWVVEGAAVPRRVISCSLAGDHRVSDGHRGARFVAAIARLLQEPQAL
jgi:pyruvate dehydrogenase E2 component (dihydrolipoamide acetyltransferase)